MEKRESNIVVTKLGGSVLVDNYSYDLAAKFLARRLQSDSDMRMVVVVSALKGLTDELERVAHRIRPKPNQRALDLLWSTGELRSVALLTLHFEDLGIEVAGLNIHETGLQSDQAAGGSVKIFSGEIRRAFQDHSVVVVPGFFATLAGGAVVSVGRGGSDLTAVLLAVELGAKHCELLKDVRGYFTEDPKTHHCPEHLPWLAYERAINMADSGCELVQRRAIEAARDFGLPLIIRSLHVSGAGSVISGSELLPINASVAEN
jgi:aspartate kinase